MDTTRIAVWLICGAYCALGVLVAAFLFLLEPNRLDIGGLTVALILMGVGSLFVAVALLAGSAIGTRAVFSNSSARRTGVVLTVLAGWIGSVVLGWFAWSFWTE